MRLAYDFAAPQQGQKTSTIGLAMWWSFPRADRVLTKVMEDDSVFQHRVRAFERNVFKLMHSPNRHVEYHFAPGIEVGLGRLLRRESTLADPKHELGHLLFFKPNWAHSDVEDIRR